MKKHGMLFLVMILMLSLLPLQSFAAGSEFVVRLKDDNGLDVVGIRVELLKIDSTDHKDLSLDRAKILYQDVIRKELTGTVKTTNGSGEVHFSGLEKGLYLIFERGGQSVTFHPYLAWLESGTLISEPKIEESGNHTFTVTKIWDDGNNADQIRPSAIEVTLLRNGLAYRKVYLSAANGWKHTFENLPNDGDYSAMEKRITGYRASYHTEEDGVVITNTHEPEIPEAIEVKVRVVWVDNNDALKKRPDHVTVQLLKEKARLRNTTVVGTAVVSDDNEWKTVFTGLEDGVYSVYQFPVNEYTTTYAAENPYSFIITNTLIPQEDPDGPGEDVPDDPVTPVEPVTPTIPQMGAITWPIYALLAVGALLIVLGTLVMKRGQSES